MDRKEMIWLLEQGKHPVDVAIRKWRDISNTYSPHTWRARHNLDEGRSNCALCYTSGLCDACPLYLYYHVACDQSITLKERTSRRYRRVYKKDFYARYRDTGNPLIMLAALIKLKRWLWLIRLLLFFRRVFSKIRAFFRRIGRMETCGVRR